MVVEVFQRFAIFISRRMSFGQCKKTFLNFFIPELLILRKKEY